MNIQIQEILEDAWKRFTQTENLVPLLVGAVIVIFGGALTLGILLPALMLGYLRMCFRVLEGEHVEVGQITEGLSHFVGSFLLGLFILVAIIVTSCTFVGPLAVMFFCMFAFQVLAQDPEVGAVDSMKKSFELTKNNLGPCALIFLIGLAINSVLSGTFVLGIPAFAFVALINTGLYMRLLRAPSTTPAAAVV